MSNSPTIDRAHTTAACAGPAPGWGACSAASRLHDLAEIEREETMLSRARC